MAGAIAVFGVLYRLALRQGTPLLAPQFTLPEKDSLDAPLMVGALIFGVGWGLGGFCPGPAIVSAAFGDARVWVFLAAMIAGMLLYRIGLRRTHD
jgi:uncharacterized membrane protein YedE/YeeE